jgi:hypothetical protein
MPCHAMHPIQDLFLEGFSYILQIDMHFIYTPMWTKFYSCKKWVLHTAGSSRVHSVGGKWYDLVIVDDYSRYSWVFLLES